MIGTEEFRSWTISNLFMVPLLKIGRKQLKSLGLVNSYLFNGEDPEAYPNAIHLLFRPEKIERFNNFIADERDAGKPIIGERDYEGGLVMITYVLPSKYEKDYELIWEGRYSETSKDYRKDIPSVVQFVKKTGIKASDMTLQHMIFNKYAPLKRYWEEQLGVELDEDAELWSKPSIETETFKLSNYEPITTNTTKAG